MKVKFFSIFDAKIGEHARPVNFMTVGQAVRTFADLAKDKETEVGAHPEDFTLFELGEFDTENGKFTNLNTPLSHGVAVEYLAKAQDLSVVGETVV